MSETPATNHYTILGIEVTATNDEVKTAYHKLALSYHPDKNNGDKHCEERFKEISTAYEILSDKSQRQAYDLARSFGAVAIGEEGNNREKKPNPKYSEPPTEKCYAFGRPLTPPTRPEPPANNLFQRPERHQAKWMP